MKIIYKYDKAISRDEIVFSSHPMHKDTLDIFKCKMLDSLKCIKVFDDEGNMYKIPQLSIFYIEYVDRKIFAYTLHNQFTIHAGSLNEIEKKIDTADFVRVRHSALVNKHCIKSIKVTRYKKRLIVLKNEEKIEVNREYAKKIDYILNQV